MNSLHHNTQFILAVAFIRLFNSDSIKPMKPTSCTNLRTLLEN